MRVILEVTATELVLVAEIGPRQARQQGAAIDQTHDLGVPTKLDCVSRAHASSNAAPM